MAGTGPANLQRMGKGLKARVGRVKTSRAAMPRASSGRAGVRGSRPPGGGGGGIAKATTPMARVTGQKRINGDKVSLGRVNLRPRADGPSRI